MSTAGDVIKVLESITAEVLAAEGLDSLGSLLNSASRLVQDVADAIKAKQPDLKAEVAAADLVADVVEAEKFNPLNPHG